MAPAKCPAEPPSPDRGRTGPRPLEEWSLARLRRRAYRLGIRGYARMRKDDLIDAIRRRTRGGGT